MKEKFTIGKLQPFWFVVQSRSRLQLGWIPIFYIHVFVWCMKICVCLCVLCLHKICKCIIVYKVFTLFVQDVLIDCCLAWSYQYFSYILVQNIFTNNKSDKCGIVKGLWGICFIATSERGYKYIIALPCNRPPTTSHNGDIYTPWDMFNVYRELI